MIRFLPPFDSSIPGRTKVSAGEKVPDTSGFKLTYAWGPDFGAAEGEKLVNQDQKIKRGYRDPITPFYFLSKADAV